MYRLAGLGKSGDPEAFDTAQKEEILRLAYVADHPGGAVLLLACGEAGGGARRGSLGLRCRWMGRRRSSRICGGSEGPIAGSQLPQ